jgi:hypothetical protein
LSQQGCFSPLNGQSSARTYRSFVGEIARCTSLGRIPTATTLETLIRCRGMCTTIHLFIRFQYGAIVLLWDHGSIPYRKSGVGCLTMTKTGGTRTTWNGPPASSICFTGSSWGILIQSGSCLLFRRKNVAHRLDLDTFCNNTSVACFCTKKVSGT